MKQMTREWLKAAQDDLQTIGYIVDVEHLAHIVAFHAQQAIEKTLKVLADKITLENDELLKKLDTLYIDSRYPGDMGLLPYGKPTLEDAKEFYDFARKVYDKACMILDIDRDEIER